MINININFDEIRRQNLNTDSLLNILEHIYLYIQENNSSNLKMNELCIVENNDYNTLRIKTIHEPININSINIVSRKEKIFFTPDSISEIKDGFIIISDKRLKNKDEVFVTYKY